MIAAVGIFRRLHKDGCHAELMRRLEIAGDVLEHRRPLRRDSGALDEFQYGSRCGFGMKPQCTMSNTSSIGLDAQPIEHAFSA